MTFVSESLRIASSRTLAMIVNVALAEVRHVLFFHFVEGLQGRSPTAVQLNQMVADASSKAHRMGGPLDLRVPDNDLLSHGQSTLSSACRRFTVLFGMGRSGSSGLWSSGIDGWPRAHGTRPHSEEVKREVRLAQTP